MKEGDEDNAKVWQFRVVREDLDELKSTLRDMNSSINTLLRSQVTPDHLEKRLSDTVTHQDSKLTQEIKAIHLKYEPVYKVGVWIVGILTIAVITLVFNLLQQVLSRK